MTNNHFSDDAIDALVDDIGSKLRAKRPMLEASHGPILLKLIRKGGGFVITINVTG